MARSLEDLGVYVWTSNQVMVTIQAWAYLFNQLWPVKSKVTVLGYDLPNFELPDNFEYASLGVQRGPEYWSNDMKGYFSSCDDEYFYLTTEDGYLITLDEDILEYAAQVVVDNLDSNLLRFNLTADLKSRGHSVIQEESDFQVIEAYQTTKFRHSLTHSIWNRKHFLKILQEGMSPWMFENDELNNSKNTGYGVYGTNKRYALGVGHGYKRGKKLSDWYKNVYDSSVQIKQEWLDEINKNNWVPEVL